VVVAGRPKDKGSASDTDVTNDKGKDATNDKGKDATNDKGKDATNDKGKDATTDKGKDATTDSLVPSRDPAAAAGNAMNVVRALKELSLDRRRLEQTVDRIAS